MLQRALQTPTAMRSRPRWLQRSRLVVGAALTLGVFATLAPQAFAGAIISNGTIKLGVDDEGQLNFFNPSTGEYRGVTFVPTDNDGTRAGCACEAWGAANGASGDQFTGFANNNRGGANNVDLVSFTSTASTALSVTSIDSRLQVTHNFHPFAGSPNLYEVTVTLRNIGTTPIADTRYTRLMDWDVEPTAFSEFVTIQRGTSSALLFSNDDGFDSGDPLTARSAISPGTTNTNFTDSGPADHGALFDFGFGSLAVGAEKTFNIYYGAAGTETAADAAVAAAAIEVFSYGQPNGGQTTGSPNTFIFAFKGVGGAPVIPRRMVGKGSVSGTGGTASYAYILNCASASNTNAPFEVRFGSQRFRLTSTSSVSCTNDPAVTNSAAFDTMTGTATGTLTTGGPGTAQFTFVDGGLGGANDRVELTIRNAANAIVFQGTAAPPAKFPGSDQATGNNTAQST
jgi:hypothetical protein